MKKINFKAIILIFKSLHGDELLDPLMKYLLSIEGHLQLYTDFVEYADAHDWDLYNKIMETDESGKYIYIYIYIYIITFVILFSLSFTVVFYYIFI